MNIRKFHITTDKSPDGIIFGYHRNTEELMFFEIKQEDIDPEIKLNIMQNIFLKLKDFLFYWSKKKCTIVELELRITFEMFWNKYNDKERSSKKRTRKLWDKLNESDQVKAYYWIDKYNRFRGSAEKKYAETYLNAELWNN